MFLDADDVYGLHVISTIIHHLQNSFFPQQRAQRLEVGVVELSVAVEIAGRIARHRRLVPYLDCLSRTGRVCLRTQ